jgi:hypothetical protein
MSDFLSVRQPDLVLTISPFVSVCATPKNFELIALFFGTEHPNTVKMYDFLGMYVTAGHCKVCAG